ncbi:phosphotransferase [Persicirhabdus sediminis]|uniref:Phosphotransferase n=2 Tax=Persicirhabdus sediminis TaxID=454144 RepID=A0A8J7SIP3_9BACT|nr:phosphotransferase [Persicirhabdus sediminis]MBK1790586.1 phosphotransferase [Persicirhabdus sediminis]
MKKLLMNDKVEQIILAATGARAIRQRQMVQSLWSGYGEIVRCQLVRGTAASVIVKHVSLPQPSAHPRGWNTDRSHQRKLRSYQVETAWYEKWAQQCGESCRVPRCLHVEKLDDELVIVLEDLDSCGFAERVTSVSEVEMLACLSWLAHFHATFLGVNPAGLWPVGTYWHLETRPDELDQLDCEQLKMMAPVIDDKLNNCVYQTLVHGDAKLANFCFSPSGREVAAVDFQYVGGGCGMKDVAYFISSCLHEDECERYESELLDFYFTELRKALIELASSVDADALEAEWRSLYPVAWTDFYRFLKGWSPGHWKIHRYSERLARQVMDDLK